MFDSTTLVGRSIVLLPAFLLLFAVLKIIYNLFFHPLRSYPGPLLWRATLFTYQWNALGGKEYLLMHNLHKKYGPVVRFAPDQLAFIEPQAWKDIHGHGTPCEKDKKFYGQDIFGNPPGLIRAGKVAHARQRRLVSHAFSDKALREQEQLLKGYVSLLLDKLREAAKGGADKKVNLVDWFNFTTFDIMADLTFGEPLKLLESSAYTPWVRSLFGNTKLLFINEIFRSWPPVSALMNAMVPARIKEQRKTHKMHSVERVEKRLARETDRPDIWTYVMRHSNSEEDKGKGLLETEMHSNAALFMVAGTETTATELSGLTYHLCKNPEKMRRLVKEVRGAFATYDDMHMTTLSQLEYLNACIEEGLRTYPPVAIGLRRVTPKGGTRIQNHWVDEGMTVSIPHYAAYHSETNFKNPDSFIPERWLPEGEKEYAGDRKEIFNPFSYGPRNCLGKNLAYHEMRLVFSSLLFHFDIELCEESEGWLEQDMFILWNKKPLMVKLTPVNR